MTKFCRCEYIDYGINFERYGVYVCCKTAHKGGGKLCLAPSYNEFDWDKIFELKKSWKQQMALGNPPKQCEGCSHILEVEELDDDLSFYFIDVNSFVNCNSRCIYCNVWDDKNFKEVSMLPRFEEMFEKNMLKNSNFGYIQFAGGEPALMLDFDKIIDLCIKNGIERYIVNSNGIKYSQGIEKLLSFTDANVFVSIDSGTSITYEKIKKVPCFDKVINNLKRYSQAQQNGKGRLWSKFIIIPEYNDNMEEISAWYDLSLSIGIKSLVLDVEREWFKNNNREITDEMKEMISFIQKKCEEDNIKLDYYESLKCLYGIH
jgi:wyosine [tRNA(Phe)-imidazoG37] synthetase (radical SAM superfamily)